MFEKSNGIVLATLASLSVAAAAQAGVVTGPPVETFTTSDSSRDIVLTGGSPTFSADLSTYANFSSQLHSLLGSHSADAGAGGFADVEHQDASSPDGIHGDIALPYAMVGRGANALTGWFLYKFKLQDGQVTGSGGTVDASVYFRHDPNDGVQGTNAYIAISDTVTIRTDRFGLDDDPSTFDAKLDMKQRFGPANGGFATYTGDVSLEIPAGLNEFYVIMTEAGSSARFAITDFDVNAVVVPEPATASLLGAGVTLLALRRRRS
jgi:hypothetical protein